MMKGMTGVFSSSMGFDSDVAEGGAQAGGMLLRTIVALGIGAVLLSVAAQVTLSLWHQSAAMMASKQAEQRAVNVAAELAQALATAKRLPDGVHWVKGGNDALAMTVVSSVTNVADSYRWYADGRIIVQRAGGYNSERFADGISTVGWQPDPSLQGGWLHVDAISDIQPFTIGDRYRRGCDTELTRACHVITRYVARPVVNEGVQEASP